MKSKFINSILIVVLLVIFTSVSESQVKTKSKVFKSPKLTVELVGSYNLPLQETKGDMADFFNFENYGASTGFGGQLNFKLALGKYGDMRPYLSLGYAQFQNSDDGVAYIDSNTIRGGYPLNTGKFGTLKGTSDLFLRCASAGLGFEYAFTKADKNKRLIPFVGLDLDLNVIWGLYTQTPSDTLPGTSQNNGTLNPGTEISFTIKSTVRFGFGIGGGLQYRLAEPFGLTLGFKYKLANLIGKESVLTKTASEDPNDENKMNLLDNADASINSLLNKSRNIGYMEIYFGFAFYIGKTKK